MYLSVHEVTQTNYWKRFLTFQHFSIVLLNKGQICHSVPFLTMSRVVASGNRNSYRLAPLRSISLLYSNLGL